MVKDDEKNTMDRISELPDDVLIKILSCLTPYEALRKTRFLSHRWKQLWEFWPAVFSFYGPTPNGYAKSYKDPADDKKFIKNLEIDCFEFVKWVNNVLISHQGSTFDELSVHLFLVKDSPHYIDKWIEIAMRKKIKRLELDLPALLDPIIYTFPKECFPGIEFLNSLRLKYVGVTDAIFEWILSNCPVLESLHVHGLPLLTHAKVSGSSLRLKHLHIVKCEYVQSIEVSAPNLVSFEYHGEYLVTLHIRHAPKFTEFYYHNPLSKTAIYLVSQLSDYLPQLLTLRLKISPQDDLSMFSKCTRLRYLNCYIYTNNGERVINLITLVKALPYLNKLKLEIINNFNRIMSILNETEVAMVHLNEVLKAVAEAHPNEHLKEVEIVGFLGQAEEAEIAAYLIKSGINLEKIVLHTDVDLEMISSEEYAETRKQMAQSLARQLMENRPRAELVLL